MGEPYRIQCAEIWGGVCTIDTDVCTSALTASIYSCSPDGEKGGDIYYFSVCSSDILTRIAIADLRGHGAQVSQLSDWLYHSLEQRMNSIEGNGILTDLNQLVNAHGFDALTTAVLASYCLRERKLYFSNAGHPPPFLYRINDRIWRRLELQESQNPMNLPLGILADAEYAQVFMPLEPGDRLFLYTDGVSEYPSWTGEEFGQERLLETLTWHSTLELGELKRVVLRRLAEHGDGRAAQDDITVMMVEVRDSSPSD